MGNFFWQTVMGGGGSRYIGGALFRGWSVFINFAASAVKTPRTYYKVQRLLLDSRLLLPRTEVFWDVTPCRVILDLNLCQVLTLFKRLTAGDGNCEFFPSTQLTVYSGHLYKCSKGVPLLQFRSLASSFLLPLCTFNSILFLWHLLPWLVYESCQLRHVRQYFMSVSVCFRLVPYTVEPVYVGHLWLHSNSLGFYRWPTYGIHLTLWKSNCLIVSCVDVHVRVQRRGSSWKAVTWPCRWTGTWKCKVVQIWPGQTVTCLHTISPGHIWTTLYVNGSVSTRKFQSCIHTFEQSTEVEWVEGSSANGWVFLPVYPVTQKVRGIFRWPA
jgi:hypothetical protein